MAQQPVPSPACISIDVGSRAFAYVLWSGGRIVQWEVMPVASAQDLVAALGPVAARHGGALTVLIERQMAVNKACLTIQAWSEMLFEVHGCDVRIVDPRHKHGQARMRALPHARRKAEAVAVCGELLRALGEEEHPSWTAATRKHDLADALLQLWFHIGEISPPTSAGRV